MEKKFTLEFDLNSLNIIVAALGELPFRVSHQVINDMNSQVAAQQSPEVVADEEIAPAE